uniref:LPXTG cell wall anchor domain-containing protein n=1 Tax=Desulfobacca acetoxidans TaxID=60893 RepID=A0A7C5EXN7_9BACT
MGEKWSGRKPEPHILVKILFLLLVIWSVTTAAAAPPPAPTGSEPQARAVDRQELEEVVNKALERQLAPIKEMLTELTIHQPSLSDIIGGIGWIMGLFGGWAYFASKKRKDS